MMSLMSIFSGALSPFGLFHFLDGEEGYIQIGNLEFPTTSEFGNML